MSTPNSPSPKLPRAPKINNLPLVFLIGENGSVKTTTLVNSGLEPELVTGQVYQGSDIIPTRLANFFLARQTLVYGRRRRLYERRHAVAAAGSAARSGPPEKRGRR